MKRYDEYKPTGIEWIGETPKHWEVMKIAHLFSSIGSGTTPSTENTDFYSDINEHYWLQTGDLNDSYIHNTAKYISDKAIKELGMTIYPKGSLVVAMYGATIGKLGLLDIETSVNQACCVLSGSKLLLSKFTFYSFLAAKGYLISFSAGGGQPNISQNIIRNHKTSVPPLLEQEAIVEYLDAKCGSIDAVIATQERRIALLSELKQSIITEAVTRGINPDAPLKDSGIEWIGKIPKHWEAKRLRFVCEFRNGYTPSKQNADFWTDGTIPWYRMEDIRDTGRFLKEAKQYVTEEAVKGAGMFDAGSFILATTATIGEHAMLIVDSLANQQFTNLKIRKSLVYKVCGKWFFYYLFLIDDFCKTSTRTATFPAMNMEDLRNCCVAIPPIEEQEAIVKYLDGKCGSIDASIAKAKREIELLREFKQSVITEAVTGKIKVY